jgi:hypothetical protein
MTGFALFFGGISVRRKDLPVRREKPARHFLPMEPVAMAR